MIKSLAAALAASLALAGTAPPSLAAEAAASPPPSAPAAAGPAFSIRTPIATLAADPGARAVLEQDAPHLLNHPMYEAFKTLSLQELAPYSSGAITPQVLAKVDADLAKLKPAPAAAHRS